MSILVLSYSATGNTRKVAKALAKALGAQLSEVTCNAYTQAFWGPLRQARDVLLQRSPPIEVPELNAQKWDLVVVGGPVWGARPAPPIRSYLQRYAAGHPKLALFVSCSGTSPKYPPERAIEEMAALTGGRLEHTHIFNQAQIADDSLASNVADFADALRAKP